MSQNWFIYLFTVLTCYTPGTTVPIGIAKDHKKCEAPKRTYEDLSRDIIKELNKLKKSAKSMDTMESAINSFLEYDPSPPLKVGSTKKKLTKDYHSESQINDAVNITRFLFGGDVRRQNSETISNFNGGIKYDAIVEDLTKWPNATVPYTFNCSFNEMGKAAVKVAMQDISSKTCIKFVPRTDESDYVEFVHGRGCWSFGGNMGLGKQYLSLQKDGCTSKGIATHEIMHSLGYEHEHMRPDRDDHIDILWDNIKPEHKVQFHALAKDFHAGKEYDYGSIMHYSDAEFAKNESMKTIKVKKKGMSIGQRMGMSPIDSWSINQLYCNCNKTSYKDCTEKK